MNRLPNFENAFVGIEKLTEYCLNEYHPYGKEKAIVFKSVLGVGINQAQLLKQAILRGVEENDCLEKGIDEYGKRYKVIMKICIFDKEASVITGWIIRKNEDFPRLTSCYVKSKKKMKKELLKLFDTVAILKDMPEKKVVFGQVGTIVEELEAGVFEVEFADRFGETISEFAIKSEDLMLLHYKLEYTEK